MQITSRRFEISPRQICSRQPYRFSLYKPDTFVRASNAQVRYLHRITKNYRGITLISIAAKVYNALLCNRIEPEIKKVRRKNQNGFQRKQSITQILTIRQIIKGVCTKNLEVILLVNFSKAFDSI